MAVEWGPALSFRERLRAEATKAAGTAANRAREAALSADGGVGPRLAALVRMDDDRPLTPETFLVMLVDAIRGDESRSLSDRDVKKAAKRRQRVTGAVGALGGPLGIYVASLYCEAAVLCDVVDRHRLDLENEDVASHLFVLWNAMPDAASARAAFDGTGPSVTAQLAGRLMDEVDLQAVDEMTKKDTVMLLWRVRGTIGDAELPGSAGTRDVILPGRRVKAITRAAKDQLGVA